MDFPLILWIYLSEITDFENYKRPLSSYWVIDDIGAQICHSIC